MRQWVMASVALAGALQWLPNAALGQSGDLGPVTVPSTHQHRLRSRLNGREYLLQVALPFSYGRSGAGDTTRFPVLYLLDGELELPLFAAMYRLSNRGASNRVVMVGVGYPPGANPGEPPPGGGLPAYRGIDYTPPPYWNSDTIADIGGRRRGSVRRSDGAQQYGGAKVFVQILREEIIPFVERHYRASTDRGIHGHSFDGLFAAYALLEDPNLFTRYAITSPSLWWDDGALLRREEAFALSRTALPKQVFLSIGSEEIPAMASAMWQFARALCWSAAAGRYEGLELVIETVVGDRHSSAGHFARALKALYPPDTLGPRVPDTKWMCDH